MHGCVAVLEELQYYKDLILFTDNNNWWPHNISHTTPNKTRIVCMEEPKLIQGFYITGMWGSSIMGAQQKNLETKALYQDMSGIQ